MARWGIGGEEVSGRNWGERDKGRGRELEGKRRSIGEGLGFTSRVG
jgi:hypothetical protein